MGFFRDVVLRDGRYKRYVKCKVWVVYVYIDWLKVRLWNFRSCLVFRFESE